MSMSTANRYSHASIPCSAACDAKKSAVTRLPTGRPCMSGNAMTTVSMDPSAIPASISSRPGMRHVDWAAGGRPARGYAGPMPVIPLIGLTTYVADVRWGSWERRSGVLPQSYFELTAAAGGRPLLVPPPSTAPDGPEAGADEVIAVLDGLVLTGGGDVDPLAYGEQPDDEVARRRPAPRRERARAAGGRTAGRPARARDLPRLPDPQRRARRHAAPAPARRDRAPGPPRRALRVRRRRRRDRPGISGRRGVRGEARGPLFAPSGHP